LERQPSSAAVNFALLNVTTVVLKSGLNITVCQVPGDVRDLHDRTVLVPLGLSLGLS
jgi:hypothetical protein